MYRSLLPVLLLSASAAAQGYAAFSLPQIQRDYSTSSLVATDACVGQLRGSGYLDHVTVSQGQVWLYSMPRYGGGVSTLPGSTFTTATAVATRQRDTFTSSDAGVMRRRDELFISHSGGVSRWWSDGTPHIEVVTTVLARARQLLTADLDGNGKLDLIGISSNDREVAVLMATGTTAFAAPIYYRTSATVRAITTRRVGSETSRRVEIATDTGLLEMPAGFVGTPTMLATATSTNSRLATIKRHDGSELVAWVRRQASGNDVLEIVPHPQAAVDLGALGVVGIAAGDFDADGDDDLVFSQQSNSCFTLAFCGDPAPVLFTRDNLGMLHIRIIPNGENIPAPDHQAAPLLADMNGDGYLDLALPFANKLQVFEAFNPQLAAQMPLPTGGNLVFGTTSYAASAEVNGTSAGTHGFTHAEAMVWDLDFNPITMGFTSQVQGRITAPVPFDSTGKAKITFFGSTDSYYSGGGLSVLWRAVRVEMISGVPTITRVGPALGGYLVNDGYVATAGTLPNATISSVALAEPDEGFNNLGGIRQIGWVTIEPPPSNPGTGPN